MEQREESMTVSVVDYGVFSSYLLWLVFNGCNFWLQLLLTLFPLF